MFEHNEEMCLSEFFTIEYVLGDKFDRKAVFYKLCEIFFVDSAQAEKLYGAIESANVREIDSEQEYLQSLRVDQYCAMMKWSAPYESWERELIAIKGEAIAAVAEMGFVNARATTENAVYKKLELGCASGLIAALRLLGFFQCEGILERSNRSAGCKNLDKAARWNDRESIVLALHYDVLRREENLARLYTLTRDTAYESLYEAAKKVYNAEISKPLFETELLEKAFGTEKAKRTHFNPQIARIVYGTLLSDNYKEKTLFGDLKALIGDICDLPLKLKRKDIECVESKASGESIVRHGEMQEIIRRIRNGDLRSLESYLPMCVTSDSHYLLEIYADAVAKMLENENVVRIDVADLGESDFEPTNNNVFVRNVREDEGNVFLLFFKGELRDSVLARAKAFLNGRIRKNFLLTRPGVTLDLSAVLPICFCDKQNLPEIDDAVDTVKLRHISSSEKFEALDDLLGRKQKQYALRGLIFGDGAREELMTLSVDSASKALDKAICAYRESGKPLTLTKEMISKCNKGYDNSQFGFGGNKNGSNK